MLTLPLTGCVAGKLLTEIVPDIGWVAWKNVPVTASDEFVTKVFRAPVVLPIGLPEASKIQLDTESVDSSNDQVPPIEPVTSQGLAPPIP